MKYRKKRIPALAWVIFFSICIGFNIDAQSRGLDVVAKSLGGDDFQIGKQYAVLIAVDRYKEWTSLRAPVADAKAIKTILESRYYIDEIVELYDEEASASGIRQLFGKLIDTVQSDDSVLIYYAGHGFTDRFNTGFWIPSDGGKDVQSQDRWIPNQQIRNFISQMKARSVAMFVDACFSGDLLNVSRGTPPTQDSSYYRNALRYTSRQVLTSGASEAVPDESEFSRQLRNFLENNTEPYIDPYSIYDRVRRGVTKSLPLFGTVPGHEQGGSLVLFLKSEEKILSPIQEKVSITQQSTAELVIALSGAENAEIFVNGKSAGRAPGLIQNLPVDQDISIEARSGFLKGKVDLTLKPKELKEVVIFLEPMKGNLFIDADIKEVDVFLDGVKIGPLGSGLVRDIQAGKHSMELRGDGVYYSGDFMIQGDETFRANVTMIPVGSLAVNVPQGAITRISGPGTYFKDFNGSFVLDDLTEGVYFLAVSGDNYLSKNARLNVLKGETTRWNPYDTGRVLLEVTPAAASVSIDGKILPQQYGEYDSDLSLGSHTLTVNSSGYIDKKTDIFIEPGTITRLEIRLEELPKASLTFPKVPYWVTVNVGPYMAVLQESTGPLTINNLPTGKKIEIKSESIIANKLHQSYNRLISLSPGTNTSIYFPSGYFSIPVLPIDLELYFLPKGLDAYIGSGMEIPFTRKGDRYVSPLLAAGEYTIGIQKPFQFAIPVSIKDGVEIEPPGFRVAVINALQSNIEVVQNKIRSKSKATTTSLLAGIAGTCLSVAAYYLGADAWNTYQSVTTAEAAIEAKSQGEFWGTVLPISAVIGGAGFGLWPIISNAKPNKQDLKVSLTDMEESLRKLRSSRSQEIVFSQPGLDRTTYAK
jgi:hypothetical protein